MQKLQSFKKYLFKNSKTLFWVLLVIGGLLFNLKPALALFGVGDVGLFDLNMLFLDALDVCDSMVKLIIQLYLLILTTMIYASLAANILQWAISLPINLGAGMVTSGWGFILGLTNTFLVLGLLIIALASILKIESYRAQKMLPKFIMVAILVNFSLVFVKGMVDIAHFFQNTLLSSFGPDFIVNGVTPIIQSLLNYSWVYLGMTLTYLVTAFIPYVNAVALVGITIWILVDIFYSSFATTILLLLITSSIASIMSLLIFVFLARIVMIWILAIFSPIAFGLSMFPVGKVTGIPLFDFDKWLKSLVEWLISGILILFLLGLGFRFIGEIMPFTPSPITIQDFTAPTILFPYLFILVYMAIVSYFAKQYTPEMANQLISQAKGVVDKGKSMWKPGTVRQRGMESAGGKKAERELAKLELKESQGMKLTRGEKLKKAGYRAFRTWRPLKTTASHEVGARIDGTASELEKNHGKDVKEAKRTFKMRDAEDRIAFASYAAKAKGAAGLEEIGDEDLKSIIKNDMAVYSPNSIKDIAKHRPDLIKDEDVGGIIQQHLVSDKYNEDTGKFKDSNVQRVVDSGIEIEGTNVTELAKSEKGRKQIVQHASYKKMVDSLSLNDIENLSEKTLEDKDFQESMSRYGKYYHINKIGQEKGGGYVNLIRNRAEGLGGKEIVKTNETLLRQSVQNPGFNAIFKPLKDAETLNEINGLGINKKVLATNQLAKAGKRLSELEKIDPSLLTKKEGIEMGTLRKKIPDLQKLFIREDSQEAKAVEDEAKGLVIGKEEVNNRARKISSNITPKQREEVDRWMSNRGISETDKAISGVWGDHEKEWALREAKKELIKERKEKELEDKQQAEIKPKEVKIKGKETMGGGAEYIHNLKGKESDQLFVLGNKKKEAASMSEEAEILQTKKSEIKKDIQETNLPTQELQRKRKELDKVEEELVKYKDKIEKVNKEISSIEKTIRPISNAIGRWQDRERQQKTLLIDPINPEGIIHEEEKRPTADRLRDFQFARSKVKKLPKVKKEAKKLLSEENVYDIKEAKLIKPAIDDNRKEFESLIKEQENFEKEVFFLEKELGKELLAVEKHVKEELLKKTRGKLNNSKAKAILFRNKIIEDKKEVETARTLIQIRNKMVGEKKQKEEQEAGLQEFE